MLVHYADYLHEHGHQPTAAYFAQEMNWGNAAMGRINSVLHGLDAKIAAGTSTITDPFFKEAYGSLKMAQTFRTADDRRSPGRRFGLYLLLHHVVHQDCGVGAAGQRDRGLDREFNSGFHERPHFAPDTKIGTRDQLEILANDYSAATNARSNQFSEGISA